MAFRRAIDLLTSHGTSPIAVGVEALKTEAQTDVDRILAARDVHGLEKLLQMSWPFPIEQYASMLMGASARGFDVLAIGPSTNGKHIRYLPPPMTPDRNRHPRVASGRDLEAAERLATQSNRIAAGRIHAWLKSHARFGGPRPRAIILYGGAHLQGYPDSIRSRLQGLGHSVIVLLPYHTDLELAIRESLGGAAGHEWIELAPGFFRPALVKDSEWLESATRDAERTAEIRHRQARGRGAK